MIAITKEERDVIASRFPEAHIVRTMKQKSKRHRYYVEESRPVMRYLNSVRDTGGGKREGDRHSDKKNRKRV